MDHFQSLVTEVGRLKEGDSGRAVLVQDNAFSDLDVGHGFGLSKRPENGPEKRRKRRG